MCGAEAQISICVRFLATRVLCRLIKQRKKTSCLQQILFQSSSLRIKQRYKQNQSPLQVKLAFIQEENMVFKFTQSISRYRNTGMLSLLPPAPQSEVIQKRLLLPSWEVVTTGFCPGDKCVIPQSQHTEVMCQLHCQYLGRMEQNTSWLLDYISFEGQGEEV